jgi:hypothetical protein
MRCSNRLRIDAYFGYLLAAIGAVLFGATAVDGATPRNLQDIFVGRCNEYQQVLFPQWVQPTKDCNDLWLKFYRSFAYKDPCGLDISSYDDFLQAARHNISTKNVTMYWSGQVTPLVYEYTARARRYVTVRDYLPGYAVQDVYEWCGKVENVTQGSGMDFDQCPPWGSCGSKMQSSESYWKALSSDFARIVEGDVRVLLNGSNGQAFRGNQSTFGGYELPQLNGSRNPVLRVQLIHDILPRANSTKETCYNGTLLQLKAQAEQQGMVYNCTDDPLDLLYFQCVDYVGADRCSNFVNVGDVFTRSTNSANLLHRASVALILKILLIYVGLFWYCH